MNNKGRIKSLILATVFSVAMIMISAGVSNAASGGIDQVAVGKCKECHSKMAAPFFEGNPHAKEWEHTAGGTFSCESCHGGGAKHMGDRAPESIIGFGKDAKASVADQSKQCLSCHSKSEKLAFWDMGKHKKNDVTCADCHKMHKGAAMVKPTSETCFGCHKDVKSQANKRSHHPIIEGKVGCADCHNPHGSLSPKMIKAENVNQLCYKCHADKRGPWVWEHQPVQENCLTCHTPHGSVHNKLLVQKPPYLCRECHNKDGHAAGNGDSMGFPGNPPPMTPSGGIPSIKVYGRGCINCHSRIHGSNAPDHSKYGGSTFTR